jgi:hypothetical protein
MAGLREGEDIDIVFTGLRPGEKIYEELHSDQERMRMTRHERILVWDLDARDERLLLSEVAELEGLARDTDPDGIKRQLSRIVPEYLEPVHDRMPAMPATPTVELPAAVASQRALAPRPTFADHARTSFEGAVAVGLLALSVPLWILMAIEARATGDREFLIHELRIGRTRRWSRRRTTGQQIAIDRRSIERRTHDLMGVPVRCARFRTDLGPVSRWLASRRLDRIPWLLNIVRGEMSLVGPGPVTEDHVVRWGGVLPDYARRFIVKPGITGLAQIAGVPGDDADGIARRAQYDLYYVEHRSFLLDIRTVFRTASVLLQAPRPASPAPSPRDLEVPAVPAAATAVPAVYPPASPPAVKGVTR